jgi:hypothetical protein
MIHRALSSADENAGLVYEWARQEYHRPSRCRVAKQEAAKKAGRVSQKSRRSDMSCRYFISTTAMAAVGIVVFLGSSPAVGQALSPSAKTAKASKSWTPLRTPNGEPDLQGVWTSNSVTPLERPKGLAGKEFYTEAELAAKIKRENERVSKADVVPDPDDTRGIPKGDDAAVHYDFSIYGMDRAQVPLAWSRRTSIIVGPEGTIPPLRPEALKRRAERAAKAKGHEFDGAENLKLEARCIIRGNLGPPMLPSNYNSNWQIVQTPEYVAIYPEMARARIIPTDGRPHLNKNIRQWYGDSVGNWEGISLVVDTTNFTDLHPFEDAQNLHVIERFTRVDDDTILYQFTVEDPGMWTKPWSGEMTISRIKGQIYEYACHEANYGLEDTLRGARVAEEEAAKKPAKESSNR